MKNMEIKLNAGIQEAGQGRAGEKKSRRGKSQGSQHHDSAQKGESVTVHEIHLNSLAERVFAKSN